jgi:hypothetical protein
MDSILRIAPPPIALTPSKENNPKNCATINDNRSRVEIYHPIVENATEVKRMGKFWML